MAENDEPLDDARAVAMTAGAAAVRVVETVIREQQNRQTQQQDQQPVAPSRDRTAEPHPSVSSLEGRAPVEGRVDGWTFDARENLISANPSTYDAQRPNRDAAMQAAGVPDEARYAKTTADLINGADPATAAASGTATTTQPALPTRTLQRERGRG